MLESTLQSLSPWALALIIVLISALFMVFIKRIILGQLARLIDKTPYHIDTLLIKAARVPLTLVIFSIGCLLYRFVLQFLDSPITWIDSYITIGSRILLIFALILFVDRFCTGWFEGYSQRSETFRSSASILKGITHGVIFGIGGLVLLSTLGISITPIVASLGISSLALALALQPTLENFFSGVQLLADKPIRVGDFIELDSGEQGFVDKIGWRSTWIRMLPNNTIIMPNSLLSKSKIINYFYPEKELSVPVEVGVHYSSDLEHVERVTLEVAREILKTHKWGVSDYETFVVYTSFADSSINFTVMLRAQEYFNRFWVKSAFIKALHQRYKEEGITIPFPIRAINTEQESAKPVAVE